VDELTRLSLAVLQSAFHGPVVPDWVRRSLDSGLGSLCLFGSNVEDVDQLAALTAELHERRPTVITATDEEGGDVTRLHMRDGSDQPGNAALGAADDPQLTRDVAAQIGHELASAGVDLDLAPVVDVNSNADNPVIGVRSFGADPALVARHTEAYVAGLQGAGVAACVKHFPGHGDTSVDSHLGLPTVHASLEVLGSRDLVPFRAAVAAGAVAVMTSHVVLPALDPTLPATLSASVLRLLRAHPAEGGLGFDGLVVSDAIDMRGAWEGRGQPAAAVLALAAGCDLLCLGPDKDAEHTGAISAAIVDAVRAGTLTEQRLADAAARVTVAAERGQRLRRGATVTAPSDAAARAAQGALRRRGRTGSLDGGLVLRFPGSSNIAVGTVPWGALPDGLVLRQQDVVDIGSDLTVDAALAHQEGRPVVALVRDLHRDPAVARAVRDLAERRPDLVVVETGWPGRDPLPGAACLLTFGASRANIAAADHALSQGWSA
jgi:beta-N-acetylhexosaminidase